MFIKKLALFSTVGALFATVACNNPESAELILKNATVVPMTDPNLTYQAVAIKNGKIIQLGTNEEVLKDSGSATKVVDCQGKFIYPGFIDAHAHIGQYAITYIAANLYGKPYGDINTIQALQDTMQAWTNRLYPNPADATVVLGNGYDDAIMTPHKHPTKADLDKISGKHPMYVIHSSGHMGVANSAMLKLLGYDTAKTNPPGGIIVRDNNGATGLLMENANVNALGFAMRLLKPSPETMMNNLLKAEQTWFAWGVTTMCEGRADANTIGMIQALSQQGKLRGDFIVLPDFDENRWLLDKWKQYYNHYDSSGHFKIGGIKFTFDGSPQGRSAALKQPYLNPPLGEKKGFTGNLIYPDSAGNFLAMVFKKGMQVHIHCNGDSAIGQALHLLDSLKGEIPKGAINVLIHAQTATREQVKQMADLKDYLRPSWFPTHTYIWGRWHIDTTLGHPRADSISPIKMGMDMGINNFTIHTDAPVTPPDLLTTVYSAVNRKTLFEPQVVLAGNSLLVPVWDAMKAITVNGALQWGEEKSGKGTIVHNGIADLVILGDNPLTINKENIKDIKVLRTYKNGVLVYSSDKDPIAK